MSSNKLLAASILSAILLVGSVAAIGSFVTPTFAQYGDDDTWDDNSTMSGNTTAASSNMSRLSGTIASLQNSAGGPPTWITSGHWQLLSDRSLFGDDAEPQVTDFRATIFMTSISNGTNLHQHEISDFRQTSVLHSSENVTTVNGMFTISMSDGPHQNTSGYLRLQNNMISIWVNPTGIDEHFGPTPIYGLIVPDDMMRQHGGDGTAVAGMDNDNGLRGDGSVDDDPIKQGNTTMQGTSGQDDDDADDLYDD